MTSYQIGPTLELGELSLTVIEKTRVDPHRMEHGVFVEARKEPYAVVVRKADAVHAFGMDGTPVSISELVEKGVWPG